MSDKAEKIYKSKHEIARWRHEKRSKIYNR